MNKQLELQQSSTPYSASNSSASMLPESDGWGPEKVPQVYDPDTGLKGILVIDNTATGPGEEVVKDD